MAFAENDEKNVSEPYLLDHQQIKQNSMHLCELLKFWEKVIEVNLDIDYEFHIYQ